MSLIPASDILTSSARSFTPIYYELMSQVEVPRYLRISTCMFHLHMVELSACSRFVHSALPFPDPLPPSLSFALYHYLVTYRITRETHPTAMYLTPQTTPNILMSFKTKGYTLSRLFPPYYLSLFFTFSNGCYIVLRMAFERHSTLMLE